MPQMKTTTEYGKFRFAKGQRPVNMETPECRALFKSMKAYGFLSAFPIMVRKNGSNDTFVIVDGQHRYSVAREMGLPIHYVVDETDIDVTVVNQGQRKWALSDYVHRWAAAGRQDYVELQQFHATYGVPLHMSAGILSGTATSSNIRRQILDGRFTIKTRELAHRVGRVISELAKLNATIAKKTIFVQALWACYFVDYFDDNRLLESFQKRPDQFQNQGSRDQFLEMIAEAYNFARRTRVPLKFDAEEAMRNRSAAPKHRG